jgi:transcription initiation factor TFIIH subunit 2
MYIVIDMSQAMNDIDIRPNRLICTVKLLQEFVREFFDQNPISQLGLIVTRNKRGERIAELTGNINTLQDALKRLINIECSGELSLQNALEIALSTLRHMPAHVSKEVLWIVGALNTCDPSDVHETIERYKVNSIRCSFVCMSAEVHLFNELAKKTKGSYDVITDEANLRDLIQTQLQPPPASLRADSSLIKMGFPQYVHETEGKPSMCVCHLDREPTFSTSGYFCPQCSSKYCFLPVECQVCGLTLASSTHIARSYHHLFPIAAFAEHESEKPIDCFSCLQSVTKGSKCDRCNRLFCIDCDIFVHEVLHLCPGCASKVRH